MRKLFQLAAPLLAAAAWPAFAQVSSVNDGSSLTSADPAAVTQFDIYLPLHDEAGLQQLIKDQVTPGSASYHQWLTPADFAARFGPSADSIERVKAAAQALGFTIQSTSARSLTVSGTVAQVATAFRTPVKTKIMVDGKTRFVADVTLPDAFKAEGAVVVEFANRPEARPLLTKAMLKVAPDNRYGADGPYWYNDLKQAYDYPAYNSFLPSGARLDGTGVGVAVLMGDQVRTTDVAQFFNHEGFQTTTGGTAAPTFQTILINGGGQIDGPDALEATLDLEQVLGGAPGATATLISLPNLSDGNILAGYNYIVQQNRWALVNSSFGECELFGTTTYVPGGAANSEASYFALEQQVFEQGNAQGITFLASSGDEGGLQCPDTNYFYGHDPRPMFIASVSNPADSPNVTAVGGTNLVTTPSTTTTLNSTYTGENGQGDPEVAQQPYGRPYGTLKNGYWGAGGGQSVLYAQPAYQTLVNTGSDMRTLPDVGMQVGGCPGSAIQPCGPDRSSVITTYNYGFGGGNYSVIGTSVSSPEFAGALALYVQANGRQGNFNAYLYQKGAAQTAAGGVNAPADQQFFHRNISGFDGYWDSNTPSINYNYIVGNGTPDVRKLFGFGGYAAAGVPRTASNP